MRTTLTPSFSSVHDTTVSHHLAASPRRRALMSFTSLVVATAVALAPLPSLRSARAAQPNAPGVVLIEVLSMASNDAVDEAAALTDAFKHALVSADGMADNGKSHALEAVALTVGCDDPMAVSCAPKMAAELKHNRFVYGTMKKVPGNKLTATLHYYDNGQMKTVVKTYDGGPVAKDGMSPELKKMALEVLYQLVGGPPKGKVAITVTGPAAKEEGDLYEGSTKVGHVSGGTASLDLPSGSHTLELRVSGFATATGTVDVNPSGGSLTLTPVRLEPSKPIDWQLYGGLGAIAAGAIFLGLGVSATLAVRDLQDDPKFVDYKKRFPSTVKDTCAEANANNAGGAPWLLGDVQKICDQASSKVKQQWIFYSLGGVLVAGGGLLILTDKKPAEEAKPADKAGSTKSPVSLRLEPAFGQGHGSLTLVGRF